MKNLGKIGILLLVSVALHAGLNVSVDSTKVMQGDSVVFTVRATGDRIEKLQLISLCGEQITSSAMGTNIRSINGNFSKENSFQYTFTPLHDCTIAPISLNIDGKKEVSEAIDIKVSKMPTSKDSPFILEMSTDKKNVRVGEPFAVTINFKMRRDAQAVDSKFTPPEIKNMWIKKEDQGARQEVDNYIVTRLTYIMAAQKEGPQRIGAAHMKIAERTRARDAWGQWLPSVKWRSYYSNELDINVSKLPSGVSIVGDFQMEVHTDKTEAQANEAVSVTLSIVGQGNFEDIGSLKPFVAQVSTFEEEPKIAEALTGGTWEQKFTFVGDNDFEVPAFKLEYFDTQTQSTKLLSTKPIHVHINGGVVSKVSDEVKVEKADTLVSVPTIQHEVKETTSLLTIGGAFLAGFLVALLLALRPWQYLKVQKETLSIRDEKALIRFLMPYIADNEVKVMVDLLEERVYRGSQKTIDKKALKVMLKKYELLKAKQKR